MRPIKFRAWTGIEMEYRVVVGQLGAFYAEGLDPKDSACISPFNTIYQSLVPIMQSTGLLDKNGVEIYEGDILKALTETASGAIVGEGYFHKLFGLSNVVVQYQARTASFLTSDKTGKRSLTNLDDYSWEVIGNIYETPELLK